MKGEIDIYVPRYIFPFSQIIVFPLKSVYKHAYFDTLANWKLISRTQCILFKTINMIIVEGMPCSHRMKQAGMLLYFLYPRQLRPSLNPGWAV